MRAAVMAAYGGPDVLEVLDVAEPGLRPGLVRVDLRAAALNWHDTLVRQGLYGSPLPHVPGADGAGVRRDTGEEVMIVPSLWWGDRAVAPGPRWEILGDHRWGTYAESVLVPQECLVPRPRGWSWEEAAALPLVGVTVHRALLGRGRLSAGERLLVLGAGGGVATMAVALGVAVGASVWVTSSRTERLQAAMAAGARGGVTYDDPDWPSAARALTPDGVGFDIILDGAGDWSRALSALRPGGRLVVLGASRSDEQLLTARSFYFGQFDLLGTTMGRTEDLRELLRIVERGRLGPPTVGATFDLSDIADAHRALESGRTRGKIVVRIR